MTEECAVCGAPGAIDMSGAEALSKKLKLLAETDNGELMCLVCYTQSESTCIHCGVEDDIYPDTRCNAEPWICRECLALPYRIHMWSCYSDGCMTHEEFAEECDRELEMERRHGDNSRGCG